MLRALLATSLLITAPVAAQVTVYSSFGPGGTYGGSGLVVATSDESQIAVAPWFTYTGPSGGSLYDIQLAMWESRVGTLEVGFYLGQPGSTLTLLDSWSVPATTTGDIFSLTSALTPQLTNGMIYSLWLSVSDPVGSWAWNFAGNDAVGTAFTVDGGDDWNVTPSTQPAFAVRILDEGPISGDVVPEPATLTLLATGSAALLATRRRRRV